MFEVIDGLPDGVIGVDAKGEVTADDYRTVLDPLIATARENGKVRLLYAIGPEVEGYTGGAAWQDTKLGFSHFASFEKVAVVTDRDGLETAVKAVGWLMPGEVKVFDDDKRAEAIAWLGGSSS